MPVVGDDASSNRGAADFSVGTVSTLAELMERCQHVKEIQQGLGSVCLPNNVFRLLGLSHPMNVSNALLDCLEPLYVEFINNVRETKKSSPFLRPLYEMHRHRRHAAAADNDAQALEAAIVLLYFIEYPNLVRRARGEVATEANFHNASDALELSDICNALSKCGAITSWARDALVPVKDGKAQTKRNGDGDYYHHLLHGLLLKSCINILRESTKYLSRNPYHARRWIRKRLFRGGSQDDIVGYYKLRADLARALSRISSAPSGEALFALPNTVSMEFGILCTLFGDDRAKELIKLAPHREEYQSALEANRGYCGETVYRTLRSMIGSKQERSSSIRSDPQLPTKGAFGSERDDAPSSCRHAGRKKPTDSRSSADRKSGHSAFCPHNGVTGFEEPSKERVCHSRALSVSRGIDNGQVRLEQDRLLANYPGISYVLVRRGARVPNVGFRLADPILFDLLRAEAAHSNTAVRRMYDVLSAIAPNLKSGIRCQLRTEYGVDPVLVRTAARVGEPKQNRVKTYYSIYYK